MNWLLTLRLVDLATISFSAGLTLGLWWVVDRVHASKTLRRARFVYLISYFSLMAAAMTEIEVTLTNNLPFSWRTITVTVAAALSLLAAGMTMLYRREVLDGMIMWAQAVANGGTHGTL